MTFICFMFTVATGVPAWILGVAMLCDTILLATAMFTGIIPHHQ